MKLGLFGGSFDPIHHGHLIAAQDVLETLSLDRVIFVPSFHSPLKDMNPGLSGEERTMLVRLAVEGVPGFDVSTVEIDRGGVSYTVETVRELKRCYPSDDLYWIIGQDQVGKLSDWRGIEELAGLIGFASVKRPGVSAPGTPEVPGLRLCPVDSHACDISSTDIRKRIREGRPIHFLTPARVVSHILERKWYS